MHVAIFISKMINILLTESVLINFLFSIKSEFKEPEKMIKNMISKGFKVIDMKVIRTTLPPLHNTDGIYDFP